MRGYRAEEWTRTQLLKVFALPLRADFEFKLVRKGPRFHESMVATSLHVYLVGVCLPSPDHKDKLSVLAGAFKRLGAEVPKCSWRDMRKILLYARKYIHPQFRTIGPGELKETLAWIDGINHPESRKAELRAAYEELQNTGLFQRPGMEDPDPSECKSFVKDEKYDDVKAARWINASSDKVKVVFGPLAHVAMDILCEHQAAIKTVPVAERARHIYMTLGGEDVVAVSADVGSMEVHYAHIPDKKTGYNDPRYRIANELMLYMVGHTLVTETMLTAVNFIYYRTPGIDKKPPALVDSIWARMEDSVTLELFMKNILEGYRTLNMREFGYVLVNAILCSGEENTSFKNFSSTFTMANYASFELSRGLIPTAAGVGEGDDSLTVYHPQYRPDEDWWKRHGWLVKIEFVGKVNEASFCGLVFAPEDLVSVPDIRKTLVKFGWTNKRYVRCSDACRMSLLRSKALSMACEYGDVPILGALAQRLLHLTRHVHVRKSILDTMDQYDRSRLQSYLRMKPWQKKPNVGNATRLLVASMQDIPIATQLLLEERFSNIQLEPFYVDELDFNLVWVDNYKRCFSEVSVPRVLDFDGRRRVVQIMSDMVDRDLVNRRRRLQRMQADLVLCKLGRI